MMNPSLTLQLFGNFALWLDGESSKLIQLPSQQQSLLAYLILHRERAVTRRQVAFSFWPDTSEKQARTNLRQLLYHTRNTVGCFDQLIEFDDGTICWRGDGLVSCDLLIFATLLADAVHATGNAEKIALLSDAVDQYTDDLLPNIYADWVMPHREACRQQVQAALNELIALLSTEHEYTAAIVCTQRLLQLDPLQEDTYRTLMELHLQADNRALAVRVYQACAERLQIELGVEPSAATVALYERVRLRQKPRQAAVPVPMPRSVHTADLKDLVGRRHELDMLSAAWQNAAQGAAQLFVIAGEAGIGKTRLGEELLLQVAQTGFTAVRTRSYAVAGDLAYGPIAEWLRSPPLKRAWMHLATPWLSEIARVVPDLLAEQPWLPQPQPLTERWQRKQLFEALALAFSAHTEPLLLMLDDLQWSDRDTLEFLHFLLRFQPTKPLLIIGTVRSGYLNDHPTLASLLLHLRRDQLVQEIELGALREAAVVAIAKQTATDDLTEQAQQLICTMSEGNPLYILEIVRSQGYLMPIIEQPPAWQRKRNRQPLVIPPRIRAVIEQRLSTLSTVASELIAVAAIIGRAFSWALLAAACNFDEDALVAALEELWQRRLIREQTGQTYDFTHDLIRAVAQEMHSPPRRRQWHQRVAKALETCHGTDLEPVSGQLGYHYEQMGEWGRAIDYYRQAAHFADNRYAAEQVVNYLKALLASLDQLPESNGNQRLRIEVLLEIADAFIALQFTTAEERQQHLQQAYKVAQQIDERRQQLEILSKMFLYHGNRGEWFICYEMVQEMLRLAETIGEERYLCMAHGSLSSVYLQRGNLPAAFHSYDRFFELYEKSDLPVFALVTRQCRMATALWLAGYPEQAHAMAHAAVELADQHAQPASRCFARDIVIYPLQHLNDRSAIQRYVEELATLCETYGFPTFMLTVQLFRGWLLVQEKAFDAGLAEMEESFVRSFAADNHFNLPYFLGLLAEAYLEADKVNSALSTLERAIQIGDAQGDWLWRAELYRLLGDVQLRTTNDAAQAEILYRTALETAHNQSARLLELRAATSLAHLWQSQGKLTEAHLLLTPLYDWFTEGFTTPDLQKAQMVLNKRSLHFCSFS